MADINLKQFSKKLKDLQKKEMRDITEIILQEMALAFLTRVIRLTPVGKSRYARIRLTDDKGQHVRYKRGKNKGKIKTKKQSVYVGGTLRRGWITKKRLFRQTQYSNAKVTPTEIQNFAKNLKIKKRGKTYVITITNPVEYAKFVNYGHRTRGGKGWVKGYFFLENAENYVNRYQNKIFKQVFERELKERLGF